MADKKIIDRIQKMLRLAGNNPNPEEADTAMRMALNLLAKHDLQMEDVAGWDQAERPNQPEFKVEDVIKEQWTNALNYPWARRLAYCIAELYFCRYFYSETYFNKDGKPVKSKHIKHSFVGQTHHAQAAAAITEWVILSINREAQKRRREQGENYVFVTEFWKGAAERVGWRALEMASEAKRGSDPDSKNALVPMSSIYEGTKKANDQWMERHVTLGKPKKNREGGKANLSARAAGDAYGKTVNLHRQLEC